MNATSVLRAIEDQERLVGVGLRVGLDFLARERRARDVAAGRIADHPGEVADHEDDVVAEVLQLPQLVELHRVTEVQIRAGRIEALLDPERLAAGELRCELGLDQDLVGAAAKDLELAWDVDGHGGGAALLVADLGGHPARGLVACPQGAAGPAEGVPGRHLLESQPCPPAYRQ